MWDQERYETDVHYCTLQEINNILSYARKYRRIEFRAYDRHVDDITGTAYIEDKMKYLYVTIKRGTRLERFAFAKDASNQEQKINGAEAFRIMNLHYKVPRRAEHNDRQGNDYLTAAGLLWYNKKYEGRRVRAWAYDQNSAYAWAMLQPMPDTSGPMRSGEISEGKEIGFAVLPPFGRADGYRLRAIFKGRSDMIFPLMPSPFGRFVEIWYDKKQNAENKSERQKAKNVLTFAVGYLQKYNVYLRAAILTYSEDFIVRKMDADTIYVSTDSIVSLRPRTDLIIGTGLGEFKIEKSGREFCFKNFVYQWDREPPTYRGVPKSWFPAGWDLLTDPLPLAGNVYELNADKLCVERRRINGEA